MKTLKRLIRDKYLLFLLLFIPLSIAVMIGTSDVIPGKHGPMPVAKKGELDLTQWDLDTKGPVKLDGEWEFYPNELLDPEDFRRGHRAEHYLAVPGPWDKGSQLIGKWGYATYRLVVHIKPTDKLLGIKKVGIRVADQLYVNGKMLGQSGKVGTDRESYQPANLPYEAFFYEQGNQVEIIINVANYDFYTGGIGLPLSFGLSQDLLFHKYVQATLEISGGVIFLVFGIFYLSLSFLLRDNNSLFLFGLYFLFASGMVFLGGAERQFLQFFPQIPFEIYWKTKDFLAFATIPLISLFSYKGYENWKYRYFLLAPGIIFALYCLFILIFPYHVYVEWNDIFHAASFLYYLWLMGILLIEYAKENNGRFEKKELRYFIVSVYLIAFFVFQYYLFYASKASTTLIGDLGLLVFIISITMMLANRYYETFTSMVQMTRKLQVADQAKDEFLIRTSHELKTPLHGIINISQSLMEMSKNPAATDSQDRLHLIYNTAYRMSNMVNDLIDLAKIKDGRLDVKIGMVNLATCVSILFEVFGFLTKGKNIVLQSHIAPDARFVLADENRLMQVLSNLVDNSLKYTDSGSIAVTSRLEAGQIVITVADTGRGIRSENHDAIFKPYERGEGASELDNRGIGLGLSIVDQLVRLMGGIVALEWSEEGKGSRFAVTLPASPTIPANQDSAFETTKATAEWATAKDMYQSGDGTYTVLVVDDEVMNIEVLLNVLAVEGWQVMTALSGEEALHKINGPHKPDVILLDVMLPGQSGYDVCRAIRQNYSLIEMPVLFVSVRNTQADLEAGLAAGGNDYLSKPFDSGEVVARVRTLLTMKQLARESTLNEMAFLHSQIKPHFLYNTLGTIMSLCYTDGPKAGELLASFSKYLRLIFNLDASDEMVLLSDELDLVQTYVNIEKARFGERLQVTIDTDANLHRFKVLPLTIQPLVENAIRHGVLKKLKGGHVQLFIRSHEGTIEVIVKDDGVGMSAEQIQDIISRENTKKGVGIANINKRISRWTGKQLVIESIPLKGTLIHMQLPILKVFPEFPDMDGKESFPE
ncbi:ATP-binding protein [Brevibacillus sp. SYSU BS000544]|uniref:ATP-binding protein n=1 Tax=Brevibacillus sp. SYSU BS000544 TaxID=3416443 RepID=UPI003CE47619